MTLSIVLPFHDPNGRLVWEDPFIEGQDPATLRAARDADPAETRRRLSGLVSFLQVLANHKA